MPMLFISGIVVLVLALIVSVRRRKTAWRPTRARPYPLWGRIVCGTLAAGIVVPIIAVSLSWPTSSLSRRLDIEHVHQTEMKMTMVQHHFFSVVPVVLHNYPQLNPFWEIGESPTVAVVASLLHFGGTALFFLIVAAIFAAQCFSRRAVGLVVSCLCAMLLVVALDRIVLEIHAKNLAPDKPPAVRAYARSQLDATFFFQKTAERLTQEK